MPSKKKEQYLVSLATPDDRLKGIEVPGRGKRMFSKNGYSFTLKDRGEAREIQKELGSSIAVSKIPNYVAPEDRGHKYNFTVRKTDDLFDDREAWRQKMIEDGWEELKPGQWKKVAQQIE